MKDKLRELAERWKVFHSISNGYTEAVNDCGTELLAILDAAPSAPEGDGGGA